jgi:hypothetical protein
MRARKLNEEINTKVKNIVKASIGRKIITDVSKIHDMLSEPDTEWIDDYVFQDNTGKDWSIFELAGHTVRVGNESSFIVGDWVEEEDNPYSDGSDGWDEDKLEEEFGLMSWIKEVEKLSYELQNARRGAYALNGDTYGDLVMYVKDLSDSISDIAGNMEDESGNKRTH